MCIIGNFMEDHFQEQLLDAEYQDYIYQRQKQLNEQQEYEHHLEEMFWDQVCKQRWEDEQQTQKEMEMMGELVEIDYI